MSIDFSNLNAEEFRKAGITFRDDEELQLFSARVLSELETRIGEAMVGCMTEKQIKEFEKISDPAEAAVWLNKNISDYQEIIKEKEEELEQQIMEADPLMCQRRAGTLSEYWLSMI